MSPVSEHLFVTANGWGVASDGIQWVLQRQRRLCGVLGWRPVSFVRSTRDILEGCMREKGVPAEDVVTLLSGLPTRFDTWAARRRTTPAPIGQRATPVGDRGGAP